MYKLVTLALSLTLIISCHCQYRGEESDEYPRRPPPQILTHKQALNHDGNFKYLFTSENGLAQGETISPDGTRVGGYSYIDPNGKKISVKYTAGKEGFKILEADHLPKAPQPVAPLPVPQQQQAAYTQPQASRNNNYDDGSYRPQQYEKSQGASQGAAQSYYHPKAYTQPIVPQRPSYPQYNQIQAREAPYSNAISDKEPEYNDEPGKANSFGAGYLFEFGSG